MENLTTASLSALLLEGIKYLLRKFVYKDMEHDLDPRLIIIILTVLNIISPFVLYYLGVNVTDPVLSMAPMDLLKFLVLSLLNVLISMFVNNAVIKPLKVYAKNREVG